MELKEIARYYIGQKCLNTWFAEGHPQRDAGWTLEGIRLDVNKCYLLQNDMHETWTENIKPILRNLFDLTKEEAKKFIDIVPDDRGGREYLSHNGYGVYWRGAGVSSGHMPFELLTSKQFHYLLSCGFDLFDLLTFGQAIDATTLNQPNKEV